MSIITFGYLRRFDLLDGELLEEMAYWKSVERDDRLENLLVVTGVHLKNPALILQMESEYSLLKEVIGNVCLNYACPDFVMSPPSKMLLGVHNFMQLYGKKGGDLLTTEDIYAYTKFAIEEFGVKMSCMEDSIVRVDRYFG